ncbi:isoprenylcysteine carboxylmethyltransferase family protein [Bacillus sp. FJAT-49736]|uniref:isoprenylcysteine carboxyl methyltransferase family protein n=1 Tax=Bacillus sp. FJAT-49736 TaxID=2833582 RepID=UPI001BC978FF|nr:isoprenylcysteine carboxylmethyltransferase family protein [Bacillus sp. FJAT-49736]MBS4173220.1 hypothetical protein [Bacillus sp. FJAT-49736]
MFFIIFLTIVLIQRIVELWIARKNEIWIKSKGGMEAGKRHYKVMVLIHTCFFLSLLMEVYLLKRTLIQNWWIFLAIFILTQAGRVWVITSLGRFWNTKILVLPNAKIITKGPYRFMKHPNYFIVTLELFLIPFMFQAYYTLIAFFILNQLILAIRINAEESILRTYTDYPAKQPFISRMKKEN